MAWNKYNDSQNLNATCKAIPVEVSSTTPSCEVCPPTACVDISTGCTDDCINTPTDIEALRTGAVAKIPVVLAELTLQINVDTIITLPEPALEIKNIKKRIKITQCLLLQDTNMLFVKGFVRKNIDYSTRKCSNYVGVCGDIKHCTVDIPFSCTTPVTFNGIAPLPIVPNTSKEFQFFKEQELDGCQFAEKDKLLSGDFSEYNQTSTEYFNELPYCELIKSKIVEYDEHLCSKKPCDPIPFEEKEFKKLEEKMVIYLTLKLLQKRQVAIGSVHGGHDC
ncbi:CsxC family protein [Crassaminicella profunda]|uniref:CsxC family protein n=1 Tax=Crassaminicella profunda TaxID=1286698 RepID=UPI001CA751AC|nr:hypothetical protein [Crassaminicella profunda]QZY54797.1 hypothetical protein K7H06_17495 [Crassaminicella profunda]